MVVDVVQVAVESVATCRVPDDAARREWALVREGTPDEPRWRLVFRSTGTGPGPVALPLPLARPEVGPGRVTLDYRSANGGRVVQWRSLAAGASAIDVFVNYELEVNVERDLDRSVDAMNTDGPLTVRCDVAGRALARDRPLASKWMIGGGVERGPPAVAIGTPAHLERQPASRQSRRQCPPAVDGCEQPLTLHLHRGRP
jgi:hypothetical protein